MGERLLQLYWLRGGSESRIVGNQTLKLCKERNWKNIIIETDGLVAVNLIKDDEGEETHPNQVLIDD